MTATEQSRLATGRVISDKMEKSITVLIERRVKHPIPNPDPKPSP